MLIKAHLQFQFPVLRISRDFAWNVSRLLLRVRRTLGLLDPFYDALPDSLAFMRHELLALDSTSRHIVLEDQRYKRIKMDGDT